ncbi:hypothetical protein Hamer_G012491, partial [Homarus americanus]
MDKLRLVDLKDDEPIFKTIQYNVLYGMNVLSVPKRNYMSNVAPYSHKEADTCIILHAMDSADRGNCKVLVRTIDSDVALCIDLDELWIAYDTGKDFCYLPIHEMASALDAKVSSAFPVFYAFTWCDATSTFVGRGKSTTWNTWHLYPQVTEIFNESNKCLQNIPLYM